jgi:hypothetical protein
MFSGLVGVVLLCPPSKLARLVEVEVLKRHDAPLSDFAALVREGTLRVPVASEPAIEALAAGAWVVWV